MKRFYLKVCFDWAKRICEEDEELDENTPTDWREVLNEYLDLIHFDKMTKEEFKSLKGVEVLSSSEINTTMTKNDSCKKFKLKYKGNTYIEFSFFHQSLLALIDNERFQTCCLGSV